MGNQGSGDLRLKAVSGEAEETDKPELDLYSDLVAFADMPEPLRQAALAPPPPVREQRPEPAPAAAIPTPTVQPRAFPEMASGNNGGQAAGTNRGQTTGNNGGQATGNNGGRVVIRQSQAAAVKGVTCPDCGRHTPGEELFCPACGAFIG